MWIWPINRKSPVVPGIFYLLRTVSSDDLSRAEVQSVNKNFRKMLALSLDEC